MINQKNPFSILTALRLEIKPKVAIHQTKGKAKKKPKFNKKRHQTRQKVSGLVPFFQGKSEGKSAFQPPSGHLGGLALCLGLEILHFHGIHPWQLVKPLHPEGTQELLRGS